ncbi:acetyl esterase [Alteribacillus persepolensis]|uniref:Acetyl esterase n=1 Tax=Alteribacillus persepolensis TaxID=568899 RepID=A0A1G8HT74_9BACI|nr:alpha/beta hydrolase [Alteribacillus persepolensis]SDI09814.1 acetyl esterase [Alteribacillus persepolensis]
MPLHPQAKAFLDQIAAAKAEGAPAIEEMTVEENRNALLENFKAIGGEPENVAKVEDLSIPVNGTDIDIRIYTPEGEGPFPVFVYYPGGGWVTGDLEVADSTLRTVTNVSECLVVSVHYRLAPEHKFPVAPEDCYAATKWVSENISKYNGDPERLAVGGDSAGGNLAAVVPLMAKDRGGPSIAYQYLIYPVTDFTFDTGSYRENGEGHFLETAGMHWFSDHYIDKEDRTNPYAAPLRADDLSNLPPALVITAEYDVLRDEGEEYADRLKEAGVPVERTRYDGQIHGFFWMSGIMDDARRSIEQVGNSLKKNLSYKHSS